MKHLSQQMLSMDLRRTSLEGYRRRLREQLRHPGLSADERVRLQRLVAASGNPKIYDASESPAPGAIDPGPMPAKPIEIDLATATHDSLSRFSHTRLYTYATQHGLDVSSGKTKAEIVETILASAERGRPS